MNHTERFSEHQRKREEERAAQVKVTWRKVSGLTGGGWSGLGPGGKLVYVDVHGARGYEYGHRDGPRRVRMGTRRTFAQAKAAAERLLES